MNFLDRLGLGRRDLRAWAMYDWANSAFQTTIIAAVFPIYFHKVAAADLPPAVATSRFAWATTIAILIVAVIAPLLGAIADYAAVKKKLLGDVSGVGVAATIGDVLDRARRLAAGAGPVRHRQRRRRRQHRVLRVAAAAPGRRVELDRVSSAGYAVGYLGGGVLLAINLLMIQMPATFGLPDAGVATRLSMASVGIWWLVFSIPMFRHVPEPPVRVDAGDRPSGNMVVTGARRLVATFHELRKYKQAFLLLVAFLLYNDGIQTIVRMATTYGAELNIDDNAMILALLITQFIGVPFAFLFGSLAGRIGAKHAVFAGLAVYAGITILGYYMQSAAQFMALAVLVGMVQGGHAGAEPLALRQHDPAPQVVGVLRLLRRVRALRRHPRSGGVRLRRRAQRHQPERHSLGDPVLRPGGGDPALRRRGCGAHRRAGG